jgi:hypothetical protein
MMKTIFILLRLIPKKKFSLYYKRMTSYQAKHRNYYLNHRQDLLEKEKEKKRWLLYYENNKDAIKQRRLAKMGAIPPLNGTLTTLLAGVPTNVATDTNAIVVEF